MPWVEITATVGARVILWCLHRVVSGESRVMQWLDRKAKRRRPPVSPPEEGSDGKPKTGAE